MAPYEALYGRPCIAHLCWVEAGESATLGPEIIRETTEMIKLIQDRLRAAQSRQKSYAGRHRRPLDFLVDDHVFVKVSPRKGAFRFGRKGKLASRFIGPFEILQWVGEVAYRLALPPPLEHVHDVFHVSMLRRYQPDPDHVIRW